MRLSLSPTNLLSYLIELGLFTPKDIIMGDYSIVDVSRRNLNFIVKPTQQPTSGYFVKQERIISSHGLSSIQNEAMIYQHVLRNNQAKLIQDSAPRILAYNEADAVIVTEYIPNSLNLRDYHNKYSRFGISHALQLGRAMGVLHNLGESDLHQKQVMYRALPAIAKYTEPNFELFETMSHESLDLLTLMQNTQQINLTLGFLQKEWQYDSIIHGDLRSENYLACSLKNPTTRQTRLKIIDWELAGLGDKAWDVGSILADYLLYWIQATPRSMQTQRSHELPHSKISLQSIQDPIRRFWQAYYEMAQMPYAYCKSCLIKSIKFCAARLIQHATELVQASNTLSGKIVHLLNLSSNIFENPLDAAVRVFGIARWGP